MQFVRYLVNTMAGFHKLYQTVEGVDYGRSALLLVGGGACWEDV